MADTRKMKTFFRLLIDGVLKTNKLFFVHEKSFLLGLFEMNEWVMEG